MSKIAVVGVQSSIGREVLSFMSENDYKSKDIIALEPGSVLGNMVSFGEEEDLDVLNLNDFDFSKVEIAIFATTEAIAKQFIPKALARGCKVIDCSQAYVSDSDVPLVIEGYNSEQIAHAVKGLIAVPSAAVAQILLPLQKVQKEYGIKRIVVSTYASTSVYGKEAMDELFTQTRKIYMNDSLADDQKVFNKQIAFNVIPQVGEFIGEETQNEWSINAEIKKILGGQVKVHANCAVIPAFIGSGQYINVECEHEVDVDDVRKLMKQTGGVVVFDKNLDGGYVTLADIQGEDNIYVSRLRQDVSVENGFSFWSVADDLRAGVAKNAFSVLQQIISTKH